MSSVHSNVSVTVKSMRKPMKELNDSDYMKPQDNFRVFQDTHPLRNATYNQALRRYEDDLKKQSLDSSFYLNEHRKRVQHD